ncbi:hypothetical protein BPOR_0479g00040 [Botrytis porri]|uniref:Uncharacterized protein n=1 Tax=Botrytis porri TaxID=87229 RepID=A0A4Z1KM45_9HELO|nr:hypothetical protein BPOR_0479g00040 [Botrytis porri]
MHTRCDTVLRTDNGSPNSTLTLAILNCSTWQSSHSEMKLEQVLDEYGGVASNKVDGILSLAMSRGHRMKRKNLQNGEGIQQQEHVTSKNV